MVRKPGARHSDWLFPEAFQFILDSQLPNGTWTSYASPIDGILNSLSSLLTLLAHQKVGGGHGQEGVTLSDRIFRAKQGLSSLLEGWSTENTDHVGFELLVPSLLDQIEHYNIRFEFSGRRALLNLRDRKEKKFKPEMVYSTIQTTALHSLEAFDGLIDFNRVVHHCTEKNGVFGSPAATAAYLMHCDSWDFRAENYLRRATSISRSGGVPSAFPTGVFETSWAISTLLLSAVETKLVDHSHGVILTSFYEDLLRQKSGLVGFTPEILEDSDDTARVLLTLSRLGTKTDPAPLIETFNSPSCFRTFQFERNPSFSANCNVLIALLSSQMREQHVNVIQNTVHFLLDSWNSGQVSDKWDLSSSYSTMLIIESIVTLLEKLDDGFLVQLPIDLLGRKLPIALCQILSKQISQQLEDGSWNRSVEETAYGIITLAKCLSLPLGTHLNQNIHKAYMRALDFIKLERVDDSNPEYLWVEKVTYGSLLLRRVYQLTAINMRIQQREWKEQIKESFSISVMCQRMTPLLTRVPLFAGCSLEYVDLALIEASRFKENLTEVRNAVLPRDELPMTKDEYLAHIPMIWTVCNQAHRHVLSSQCLWDMIVISMLYYQIDEFMETVVGELADALLPSLILRIIEICDLGGGSSTIRQIQHGDATVLEIIYGDEQQSSSKGQSETRPVNHSDLSKIVAAVTRYIDHIRHHRNVTRMPLQDQNTLTTSLCDFLIAHIVQNLNSRRSSTATTQSTDDFLHREMKYSYFDWVRASGGPSTSCVLSFRFFVSLLGQRARGLFRGARPRYLSNALAVHLVTMCRMYNYYGSTVRDKDEGSLNSLDFPDFNEALLEPRDHLNATNDFMAGEPTLEAKKVKLLDLADIERSNMEVSFRELKRSVRNDDTVEALRVFVDVTYLFGHICRKRFVEPSEEAACVKMIDIQCSTHAFQT